jgi:hypothetical protein
LILPVLAIVRFGLYYANLQQVTLASRIGAEVASQTQNLASFSTIPEDVLDAIRHSLATAGIGSYQVRLEHKGPSGPVVVLPIGSVGCGPSENLSDPLLGQYVRLTICVPVAELAPRYTDVFGLGIWENAEMVECTTVFRYQSHNEVSP